jgi:hypothetical protein
VNAFLALAERQIIPAPVKAQRRAAETRRARAQEKALAERAAQFLVWQREHRAQLDAALTGPHGAKLAAFLGFLECLTLETIVTLVERVRADGWISADADTRFLVLRLADAAIVQLRERAGLEPFEDPMFDRPPDAFLVLREMLQ